MKKIIALMLTLMLCAFAFVGCQPTEQTSDITAAGDYLFSLYKDDSAVTPSDYDVVGLIKIGDVTYTVEWTVNVEGITVKESSKAGFFTIDVDEKTETEINYTLTATVKAEDGTTVQKTFDRTVPAYKLMSYAEYAAAADDSTVAVKGIVIGIFSKSNGSSANGLYLQDENGEGGYYVYGIADGKDPSADLGIKVGMTVAATGAKDTYNGLYEVIDGAIEILDETEKTVTPVDYTEAFKNAEKLSDEALVGKQSMLVTIKGVEITGQDTSNGYFKFKLGELETYVRLSSSNNCITVAEKDTFKATHTEKFGYTADVTGIVQLYSGNLYLIPATVDAFTNFALPERSDAEKVEMEVGNITIADRITEDTVIELPLTGSTYENVKFTWVSDNACAVVGEDGKLTITLPEEDAKVTLTLTVKCGELTETKTFELLVNSASTDVYIPEKVEAPEAGKTFKLFLAQNNLGENLYFAGYMSGNFIATTNKADKAVDVTIETVEGGVRFSFMDGETKKYIDIHEYSAGKVGVRLTAEPTAVFVYDETLKVYTATVIEKVWYLGTYSNYNTISASETFRISGENASKVGVSQFPAYFANIVVKEVAPVIKTELKAETAYKLFLTQNNLGEDLYFAGYMSGNFFATTNKISKATDVFVETVEGGVRFYFMDGETKKYIDIHEYSAGKVGVRLTEEPTAVFVYDEALKVYTATVIEKVWYLGTYNNYNTISASETFRISGENASKVGVSQFPAYFATIEIVAE